MNKQKIQKSFEIDFGHRVWTQVTNKELAGTIVCPCRLLHGHRGKIILELEGAVDPTNGMIIDFKNLEYIKKLMNQLLDHKFLIDINDPMIDHYINTWKVDRDCNIVTNFEEVYSGKDHENKMHKEIMMFLFAQTNLDKIVFTIDKNTQNVHDEWLCSFTFCNFVPTAENISNMILVTTRYLLQKHHIFNLNVTSVQFYETPTGSAIAYI